MKKMRFVAAVSMLMIAGFSNAQGVLNANILGKDGKPMPKVDNLSQPKQSPEQYKFLNNPSENKEDTEEYNLDYTKSENFWNSTFYANKNIEFNGCEIRIREYHFDLQSISYLETNRDTIRIKTEFALTTPMDKNEQEDFVKEYRFRRSVCSFRRNFN